MTEHPKFERDPDEIKPVSEESKRKFRELIALLTQKQKPNKHGNRYLPVHLDADHLIGLDYYPDNSKGPYQGLLARAIFETTIQASGRVEVNRKSYSLTQDGGVERLDDEDVVDESDPSTLEINPAVGESQLVADEEARELGLTHVSEAEFKTVIEQLEKLAGQER